MLRAPLRRSRARALLAGAACALILGAASPSPPSAQAALPLQGGWEACNVTLHLEVCQSRLQAIADAGFRVVLTAALPGNASPALIDAYASTARARGVRIIWSFSDPLWGTALADGVELSGRYTRLAAACGCRDNASVLDYTIRYLSSTGVSYGYYLADDSQVAGDAFVFDRAAALAQRIRAIDGTQRTIMGTWGLMQTDMFTRAARALDTPAQELYAVGGPLDRAEPDAAGVRELVAASAARAQRVADAAGRPAAFIMQAFSWSDNLLDARNSGQCARDATAASCPPDVAHYPTRAELLAARDAVLLNARPELLLYYSLTASLGWPAGEHFGPDQRVPGAAEQARRWEDLKAAAFAPEPRTRARLTMPRRARAGRPLRATLAVQARGGLRAVQWDVRGARRIGPCRRACALRITRPGRYRVHVRVTDGTGATLTRSRVVSVSGGDRSRHP